MAKCEDITADLVRKLLDYNSSTGIFRWKERPPEMFQGGQRQSNSCSIWNAKYAGTVAGAASSHGYVQIRIFGRRYLLHRLAWLWMTGEWPDAEIDHINCDKSDNRWLNIRASSRSQNGANRRTHSNNTSGFKGVSLNKRVRKWHAGIMKDGRTIHLGCYDTADEAYAEYCAAAEKLFGEFARVA